MITIPKNTYNDLQKLTKDFVSKGFLPILNTWQLRSRNGFLCGTSTNLEVTLVVETIIESVECDFVINKDAKPSPGIVTLENARLTLGSISMKASFDESELPPLPTNEDDDPITYMEDYKPLTKIIDAVSTDNYARPILTHIHIASERLEGADGFRLHTFNFPSRAETFIPLAVTKWLIKNKVEYIRVYNKMITCTAKGYECELYYKLKEKMQYPNVQVVMPKFDIEHNFLFFPKDMVAVLSEYTPTREHSGLIVMSFEGDALTFSKDSVDLDGMNYNASITVDNCSITKSTGINHRYLLSSLKILAQDELATFSQSNFDQAILISQGDITIVIMPMRIDL